LTEPALHSLKHSMRRAAAAAAWSAYWSVACAPLILVRQAHAANTCEQKRPADGQ
jgi:hypothetical protein